MEISIQKLGVTFDKQRNVFYVSGKKVPFATSYSLKNEITGNSVEFNFTHSTGSEWDKNTLWVYENSDGDLKLHVGNDDVTPQHAENYLRAKTRY